MASTQTSFDSMLRGFDENRTRHDKFQRSLEELKDMMRTLLAMETCSSSIVRSVPIPVPPNPLMRGVSQVDMRFAEATSPVVRPSPIHPNRRQDWFQDQEIQNCSNPHFWIRKCEQSQDKDYSEVDNRVVEDEDREHVLDAPIEAKRISGAVLADELHQQPESVSKIIVCEFDGPESTSVPYKLSEMSCIQGNQFGFFREKDPSMSKDLLSSSSLLQKSKLSCHEAIEDSVAKADANRQIMYVSSMSSSPSKTEDGLHKIDTTIDTSTPEIVPNNVVQMGDGLFLEAHHLLEEMPMGDGSAKLQEMELQKDEAKSCSCSPIAFSCEQLLAELPPPNHLLSRFGVHLDVEANSILQGKICEALPSSEIGIGNVKFFELEFDGMKCGGLVRDCEKPNFHAFGVSLGSWNLDLHPQFVDGNVGSKAMEFRVMNQPFLNAHEVFEKRSEKEMVNVDDSIGLLSTLRGVFGSIDFPSSIVFDPGKGLQLSPHIEIVETIFVFDPGGLDFQWLVLCVLLLNWCCVFVEFCCSC